MDLVTRLQCHNTALETELRLVKEQLAQAHASTNYLLTTITNQQAQHERGTITSLQTRLEDALVENTHLRAQLHERPRVTQHIGAGHGAIVARAAQVARQLSEALPPSPTLTGNAIETPEGEVLSEEVDDLMSFVDDEIGSSVRKPLERSVVRGRTGHVAHPADSALMDSLPPPGLGRHAAQAPGAAKADREAILAVQYENGHPTLETGRSIRHADGTTSFITETPPSTTPPPHAPTGPRHHFVHLERAYLLSQATWIEDMDDEEYTAKFEEIAKTGRWRDRHGAEEWRRFYEDIVGPEFRRREAEKAASMARPADKQEEAENNAADEVDAVAGAEPPSDDARVDEDTEIEEATGVDSDVEDNDTEADNSEVDTIMPEDPFVDAPESMEWVDGGPKILVAETAQNAAAVEDWIGIKGPAEARDQPDAIVGTKPAVQDRDAAEPAPVAEIKMEGIMDSRWAPKPTALQCTFLREVVSFADAGAKTGVDELLSVDKFCAQQNARDALAMAGQRHLNQSSRHPADIPSRHDSPVSELPGRNIAFHLRGPRPRYPRHTGSSGRGSYPDTRPSDSRPPCCLNPIYIDELFHSNFAHDPSVLRTVMISNIPPTVTLAEILDKVHGDKILSASYLETSKMRMETGSVMLMNSALITFLYARDAKRFAEASMGEKRLSFEASEAFIHPGSYVAVVTHIAAPIRPAPITPGTTIRDIREHGTTRVVFLVDNHMKESKQVMTDVLALLAQRPDLEGTYVRYPLRMGRDADGVLWFEFASIVDAVLVRRALERMPSWGEYLGMGKGFLPDTCERKVVRAAGMPEVGTGGKEMMVVKEDGEADEGSEDGEIKDEYDAKAKGDAEEYITTMPPMPAYPAAAYGASTNATSSVPIPRINPFNAAGLEDIGHAKALAAEATKGGEKSRGRGRRTSARAVYEVGTAEDGGESKDGRLREEEAFGMEG